MEMVRNEVHSSSDHLPSVGESSSSTSLSSQQDVEDDGMIAAVLSEEYAKLDGSVGRRLTNLEPVAVTVYGLIGSEAVLVTEIASSVQFLTSSTGHPSIINMSERRLSSRTGEWGDHVTLQAAADKRYMFYRNYPTTSGTSARTLAKLLVGSALQLAIRHPRCCGAAEAKEEALVVLRKEVTISGTICMQEIVKIQTFLFLIIRSCQGFEGLDIGQSRLSIARPLLFKMTDHGALLAIKKNV
ncbi:hypothetical protein Tco_0769823 [Tanacetum coccineum]|uniref:Uncharacterized protein n=1 Tax=Tanacetum coccineum TaxID=301880 RepID=A0ABQ4ZDE2_9ASTR